MQICMAIKEMILKGCIRIIYCKDAANNNINDMCIVGFHSECDKRGSILANWSMGI